MTMARGTEAINPSLPGSVDITAASPATVIMLAPNKAAESCRLDAPRLA